MLKILNIFFVILGVIFFILIASSSYFWIADPLNLKPMLFGNETIESESESEIENPNPLLNETQEKALETFGIDTSALPSEITAEQEACFESILGASRVEEIKAGDSPTFLEVLKSKDCI